MRSSIHLYNGIEMHLKKTFSCSFQNKAVYLLELKWRANVSQIDLFCINFLIKT